MEDMVDRGQAGVLVDAVVAGDVVRGEQRLVVLSGAGTAVGSVVPIGANGWPDRVHRARGVAHVGDDGVAGLLGVADLRLEAQVRIGIGLRPAHERVVGGVVARAHVGNRQVGAVHDGLLRRERDLADPVGPDHRRIEHVHVDQLDAEPRGVGLHVGKGGEEVIASVAILGAGDQLAGDNAVGVVLAHQHVDRGMTAVGLALVDQQGGVVVEGRRDAVVENRVAEGVDGEVAGRVRQGAAAEHHHVRRRTGGARIIERVARRQRDQHKAAALGDEVEAVVEELAERSKVIVEGNAAEDAGVRDEGGLRRADDAVADRDSRTARLHHGRRRRRIVGRARRVDVGIGDELGDGARRGARRGNRGLGELSRKIGRHDDRLAVRAEDRGAVTTIDDLHRHRVEGEAVRRAVVGVVGGEDSQEVGVGLAPVRIDVVAGPGHSAVGIVGEPTDEIVVFAGNLANAGWIQRTKELGVIVPDIDLLQEVTKFCAPRLIVSS